MYNDLDKFEPIIKIGVIGIGGAGNNAVNRMIDDNVSNVEFYVANTDKQSLSLSKAGNRIILGINSTAGLGAGGDPVMGKKAAEESLDEIKSILENKDMVFIAAGMGGGTGTGGAPVIAKAAKDMGILTIAIVTRPFSFEGKEKLAIAIDGINELKKNVDSIIIVSNDKLLMYEGKNYVSNAFKEADSVLARSVKTITDIIMTPYLMNLDFADLKKVLKDSGVALIGYGIGSGENKCEDAVNNAISCPLLETTIFGARKCLCCISSGPKIIMNDINSCINKITKYAGTDVDIKFALTTNPELGDDIVISIVASDFQNSDEIINKGNTMLENSVNNIFNPSNDDIKPNEDTKETDAEKQKKENEEFIPKFLNDEDQNDLF